MNQREMAAQKIVGKLQPHLQQDAVKNALAKTYLEQPERFFTENVAIDLQVAVDEAMKLMNQAIGCVISPKLGAAMADWLSRNERKVA